jgi:hemin uptake protein HemP
MLMRIIIINISMNKLIPKESGFDSVTRQPASDNGTAPRRIPSQLLFEHCREVLIEHRGREYRLRVTAAGKLILTA